MTSPDDDVSRETPPVPDTARGVFAARLDVAQDFVRLLATEGVTRGLIGPREAPRLWGRHLLNCAVLTDLLPEGDDVCDIGSGAGLPGLVLAIRRPDLQVTLVEPLLRRTTFLEEAVERLHLDNVEVVRARAEELHGVRTFSVVTSRAVAPLPRLLAWSMPLVRADGELVAMKGSTASDELAAVQPQLQQRQVVTAQVLTVGAGVIDPPTTVIRVRIGGTSPLGWDLEQSGRAATTSRPRRAKGGRRT